MSVSKHKAQEKIKYMFWVLMGGILLLAIKFYAWKLTGSVAIFSDALESIVNVVSGTVALLSLYYAAQPKDSDHPYGHGKIEFVAAGFEGGLILIAGSVIIIKGIYYLFIPYELQNIQEGLWLVIFSGLGNGLMGWFLIKKGRVLNSPTLHADGKHLLTDTYSSIGLIVSLFLVYITGYAIIDSIVSIILGIWILFTGYILVRKSIGSLLDKADDKTIDVITSILNSNRQEKWIDIHNLRVQKYGSDIHIDCHLTLPWYDNLEKTHHEVNMLHEIMSKEIGQEIELFIHTDPCLPTSCSICSIKKCLHRKFDFSNKIVWNSSNLQANQKHS
jgi:cation diffusion facilitator family transporter